MPKNPKLQTALNSMASVISAMAMEFSHVKAENWALLELLQLADQTLYNRLAPSGSG
jgi:hypothetical protein